MANWGLLGGIGRGLNQFGDTLNRGLNSDIQAKRQEKSSADRQAIIDKRWAKQDADNLKREQVATERYNEGKATQAERYKVQDAKDNRNMDLRESQSIESNISGILNARQKAESDIIKKYEKQSKDPLGMPLQGEALQQLNSAMTQELKSTRQQYSKLIDDRVSSYGERLRKTGYAYLLDIPEPEVNNSPTTKEEPKSIDSNNSRKAMYEKILAGNATPDEPKEKSFLNWAVGDGTDTHAEPTFAAGYARGLGGFYDNSARPTDESDLSPMESYQYSMGHLAAGIPGLMGDGVQVVNDYAIQPVWNYLNTKPSDRK